MTETCITTNNYNENKTTQSTSKEKSAEVVEADLVMTATFAVTNKIYLLVSFIKKDLEQSLKDYPCREWCKYNHQSIMQYY